MDTINLNKNVISLSKGEVISLSKMPAIDLSKGGHGLKKVCVGLGWDPAMIEKKGFFGKVTRVPGSSIDCDAFAMLLNNGRIANSEDLIYYGHLRHKNGYIYHTGDNLTGDGDGDDEQIVIDLEHISCDKIIIAVNIYQGRSRHQHFGMLENAFVRIVDMQGNDELCRFTLDNKYSNEVSVIFGELVRTNGEWNFVARGEAINKDSIAEIAHGYGY